MGLRIVEIILASDVAGFLEPPIRGVDVVGLWRQDLYHGLSLVRILVQGEQTEELLEICCKRYGSLPEFKAMVLAVEAALPREEGKEPPAPELTKAAKMIKPPGRISREELYQDIEQAARSSWVFFTMTALSALVAAMGLIHGNLAVIIGAMVITPLLGSNTALSLAVVLGDASLALRAAKTLAAGALVALVLAGLLGLTLGGDPDSSELYARARASWGDLILALASGAAGALAFTTGISSALVGVMVAVALLPPLVACGLFLARGLFIFAQGAGLLFLVNLAAVNFAGVVVFLIQKIKPPFKEDAPLAQKMTLFFSAGWLVILGLIMAALTGGRWGD